MEYVHLWLYVLKIQYKTMYPDFSYLFHDLFGTEIGNGLSLIKTFGFFLAMAFIISGFLIAAEFKRKEKEGLMKGIKEVEIIGAAPTIQEVLTTGLIGFLLGFKLLYIIQNFDETKADAARVLLSGKGVLWAGLVTGAVFAAWRYLEKKRAQKDKPVKKETIIMPHQRIGDILIVAAISGVVGAKIFAIIEPEAFQEFLKRPFQTFFSGSGLAMLGGLIMGFLAVFIHVKRKKIDAIHVMDVSGLALLMGYGIGRMGCHFSGDGDWGIANTFEKPFSWFPDWLWAYNYPNNIAGDCESYTFEKTILNGDCNFAETPYIIDPVWTTSPYETIISFILLGILWSIRKRIKVAGVLFFIFLMFYGLERFLIEFIRINHRYEAFFNLTQAQIISLSFIPISLISIWYLQKRSKEGNPVIF
ncbi:MAG: prolipoprotein diacylglyceryl transferase family protein [Bacteroidota bacterium]